MSATEVGTSADLPEAFDSPMSAGLSEVADAVDLAAASSDAPKAAHPSSGVDQQSFGMPFEVDFASSSAPKAAQSCSTDPFESWPGM